MSSLFWFKFVSGTESKEKRKNEIVVKIFQEKNKLMRRMIVNKTLF